MRRPFFILLVLLGFIVLSVVSLHAQGGTPPPPTPAPTPAPTPPADIPAIITRLLKDCNGIGQCILAVWDLFGPAGLAVFIVILIGVFAYQRGWFRSLIQWGHKRSGRAPNPTHEYLQQFIAEYEHPKFKSLRRMAKNPHVPPPKLKDIYQPVLMTFEPTEAERAAAAKSKQSAGGGAEVMGVGLRERVEPIGLTEAIKQSPRLAIRGIPGSGKSSLLQWAGITCAQALLNPKGLDKDQQAFIAALDKPLLPVFISLGKFNTYCKTREPTAAALTDFLTEHFNKRFEGQRSQLTAPQLPPHFFDGKLKEGCLLLLDGVDEVPFKRRAAVRKAIQELLNLYPQARTRALLTSRPRAYADEAVAPDFRLGEVAALDKPQRDDLIKKLFEFYEGSQAADKIEDLIQSIDASDERVRRLAETPLLTTIFTIIRAAGRHFPEQRAELYDLAIEVLLGQEYHEDEVLAATQEIEGDPATQRIRLALLAFHLHLAGRSEEGMLEGDLINRVMRSKFPTVAAEYPQKYQEIHNFMFSVANRNGLLTEEDDAYSFRDHRTFQEYLAGWHFVNSYEPYDLKKQGEFIAERLTDDQFEQWLEPIRLAAGSLAIKDIERPDQFLRMLMTLGETPQARDYAIALAGLSLNDLPPQRVRPALREELTPLMLEVFQRTSLKPALRRELGLALGSIKDPADPTRLFDTRFAPTPTLPRDKKHSREREYTPLSRLRGWGWGSSSLPSSPSPRVPSRWARATTKPNCSKRRTPSRGLTSSRSTRCMFPNLRLENIP